MKLRATDQIHISAISSDTLKPGAEFDVSDAMGEELLKKRPDAIEYVGPSAVLRTDGPTVEEFVAAGYQADNYPPEGYASRSTDEEIADAQRRQAAERQQKEKTVKDAPQTKDSGAAPANKAAPAAPSNKTKATAPGAKAKSQGN